MQCPPDQAGLERRKFHLVPAAVEDVLGVDAEPVEDHGELVDQRDVDVALGVLDDLGRLGDLDRGARWVPAVTTEP